MVRLPARRCGNVAGGNIVSTRWSVHLGFHSIASEYEGPFYSQKRHVVSA